MAHQLIVRRELSRLVPVTAYDMEMLSAVTMGQDLSAVLTMSRSLRQNKFYWALLGKVVANHSFYKRSEALHLWLKTRLGYVEEIIFHDGEIHTRVTSTAFDAMDGLEMRKYMDAAIDVIVTEVLPGVKRHALLGEVEHMLGVKFDAVFAMREAA